jgi:protein tyrosine/serine phosphatase
MRLALLLTTALSVAVSAAPSDTQREIPIERFHQVDEHLYRGAQPTAEGFRKLRDLGVKVIVNLRMPADAARTDEKRVVESLGMRYVHMPVEDGNFFTRSRRIPESVIRDFFKLVQDTASGPVFVHCHRGADRTGALVAFYRIARQGWDNARALKEAKEIGMRSWYHGLHDQITRFTTSVLLDN